MSDKQQSAQSRYDGKLFVYPGACLRVKSQERSDTKLDQKGINQITIKPTENCNQLSEDHLAPIKKSGLTIPANRRNVIGGTKSFDLDWVDSKRYSARNIPATRKHSLRTYSEYSKPKYKSLLKRNSFEMEQSSTQMGDKYLNPNSEAILFDISEGSTGYLDGQNLDGLLTDGLSTKESDARYDGNRLDEPIWDTLSRDLSGIYQKMKITAVPLNFEDVYKVVLRGWDLWGPLLLCTFLALSLHNSDTVKVPSGPHFADVFVLIWFGSGLISVNYRLLCISSVNDQSSRLQTREQTSGDLSTSNTSPNRPTSEPQVQLSKSPPSILQLMCVFGYCLVIPSAGVIIVKFLSIGSLRLLVGIVFGFIWPTLCSVKILNRYQHPDKQALAIYPICLFYFVLSSLIILNH